jgi:mono/diheme cytochrome c family protein
VTPKEVQVNCVFVHRRSASLIVLGILAALLGVAVPVLRGQATEQPRRAEGSPAGNAENGKKQFRTHGCLSCHGYSGQGGAGARLAQNPITFQAFVNYVRKPRGSMPPFGSQVTEAELADIYAFLKSVPPSPDPKSIPLLNQIE